MKIKLGFSTGINVGNLGVRKASGAATDTTAPTVVITCTQTGPTATTPLSFTFTLSEASTDFVIGDITVGNGSSSNFTGSGISYTCNITPGASGDVTVQVAANAFHDAAGNGNTASSVFTITYIQFLFNDTFTTAESAPIVTPRTCEPGPGTMTVTDTGNILSLSGGKLVVNGTNAAYGRTGVQTLAAGLCFKTEAARISGTTYARMAVQNGSTISVAVNDMVFYAANQVDIKDSGYGVPSAYNSIGSKQYCIMRGDGRCFWIVDSTLVWISKTPLTSALYGYIGANSGPVNNTFDSFCVCQLPAPWNSDTGIATGYTASPASGATLTHEADAIIEVAWTATTNATFELDIRRTDDDNRWIVRCDQAGSTIKLIERSSGSETERSSIAQTWTNGSVYRITAIAFGNTIKTYVTPANGAIAVKANYTSASFNNTATIAKITASAGALATFATWPRTLSGNALSLIQTPNP